MFVNKMYRYSAPMNFLCMLARVINMAKHSLEIQTSVAVTDCVADAIEMSDLVVVKWGPY